MLSASIVKETAKKLSLNLENVVLHALFIVQPVHNACGDVCKSSSAALLCLRFPATKVGKLK